MKVFDEVYGPFKKNQSSILRFKICDEEIEYKNRRIQSLSLEEKDGLIDEIEIF